MPENKAPNPAEDADSSQNSELPPAVYHTANLYFRLIIFSMLKQQGFPDDPVGDVIATCSKGHQINAYQAGLICELFFEMLLLQRELWHQQSETAASDEMIRMLHDICNHYLPADDSGISKYLNTVQLLKVARSMTEMPQIFLSFGNRLNDLAALRLSQLDPDDPERAQGIALALELLPIEQRLDFAQQSPGLANSANCNIQERQQEALVGLYRILKQMRNDSVCAIETIALSAAEEDSVRAADIDPHVRAEFDRPMETHRRDLQERGMQLARQLRFSCVLQQDELPYDISCDAVATMNSRGDLQYMGLCDYKDMPSEACVSGTAVTEKQHRYLHRRQITHKDCIDIETYLIGQLEPSIDSVAMWKRVFENIEPELVERYVQALHDLQLLREKRDVPCKEAEEQMRYQEKVRFSRCANELALKMSEMQDDEYLSQFEHQFERFNYFFAKELYHRAVDSFIVMYNIIATQNDVLQRNNEHIEYIAMKLFELQTHLIGNVRSCMQTRKQLIDDHAAESDRIDAIMAEFEAKAADDIYACHKLSEEMANIDEQYLQDLKPVEMQRADEFLASATISPFGSPEAEQEIAIFRKMHRPAIRVRLENMLGLRLADLTICSQFHLVRYIREKSFDEVREIGQVIQGDPPRGPQERINMATSFLACARRRENGDAILQIAPMKGADDFFGLYAQMVDDIDSMLPRIHTLIASEGTADKHNLDAIRTKLLNRPNILLTQVKKAIKDEPIDIGEKVNELRDQFRHEDDQIQFVKNTLVGFAGNPRDSVAALGGMEAFLENIDEVELVEMSSAQVAADGSLFDQMTDAIREQFSPKSAEKFRSSFPTEDATMYVLRAADKLVSFFSISIRAENMHEIDWLTTPQDSPLQGLTQPMCAHILQRESATRSLYADVKPFVEDSMFTGIEQTKMVMFGTTVDDEQPTKHVRIRLPGANENYIGHTVSEQQKHDLIAACDEPNKIVKDKNIDGNPVRVVRVDYQEGRNYKSDVNETSPDGLLYAQAPEVFGDNEWVCTRVWKNNAASNGGRSYVYLLEPSQMARDDYTSLVGSIREAHDVELSSAIAV